MTAAALCHGSRVNCFVDPCRVNSCPAFRQAECVADFCDGCNANFFHGNKALSWAECGLSKPVGRYLKDDTENEGGWRPSSSTTQQRNPSPSPGRGASSSTRRRSGLFRRITRWRQINAIRANQRQRARQQRRLQQQNQRSQRQRQNSSRTRQLKSRPPPRSRTRSLQNHSNNSNTRLGRRRRPSSSSGFLGRLLRG